MPFPIRTGFHERGPDFPAMTPSVPPPFPSEELTGGCVARFFFRGFTSRSQGFSHFSVRQFRTTLQTCRSFFPIASPFSICSQFCVGSFFFGSPNQQHLSYSTLVRTCHPLFFFLFFLDCLPLSPFFSIAAPFLFFSSVRSFLPSSFAPFFCPLSNPTPSMAPITSWISFLRRLGSLLFLLIFQVMSLVHARCVPSQFADLSVPRDRCLQAVS